MHPQSKITELHKAGAHFVRLVKKRPIDKGWQNKPLSLDEALVAKELGIIPGSVGLVIIDVDVHDGGELPPRITVVANSLGHPLCQYSTPSGGVHMGYKKEDGDVSNGVWKYGDIRADHGYIVLHDEAQILEAVRRVPTAKVANLSKLPKPKAIGRSRTLEGYLSKLREATPNTRHAIMTEVATKMQSQGLLTDDAKREFQSACLSIGKSKDEIDSVLSWVKKEISIRAPILVSTAANDITPKRARWIWDNWIPLKAITLIAGIEGLGKSTYALHLAARLTRGQLKGDFHEKPVHVSIYATEDDTDAIIVPRLMAAGANLGQIRFIKGKQKGEGAIEPVSIERDIALLNPNRKIFEARKRETAALGAGEKLVLGHPLAATIGDSARCMQNLEKVLFTGPKTSRHGDVYLRLGLNPISLNMTRNF